MPQTNTNPVKYSPKMTVLPASLFAGKTAFSTLKINKRIKNDKNCNHPLPRSLYAVKTDWAFAKPLKLKAV
ncbi:hypothetical protein [Neisseria chenwenguii]|uniref:hypothetical protein n=1 Tax=Neisseria chenwenguii TaxID=1853278 RepID=UPI000F511BBF|nr:hypothetical protein [Neisseria chenwenguii]